MTSPPPLNYHSPQPPNPATLRKLLVLVACMLVGALVWFGVFFLVARNVDDAIVPSLLEYLCLGITFVFALLAVIFTLARRAGARSVAFALICLVATVGLFFAVGFWYRALPSTSCVAGTIAPFAALLAVVSRR